MWETFLTASRFYPEIKDLQFTIHFLEIVKWYSTERPPVKSYPKKTVVNSLQPLYHCAKTINTDPGSPSQKITKLIIRDENMRAFRVRAEIGLLKALQQICFNGRLA